MDSRLALGSLSRLSLPRRPGRGAARRLTRVLEARPAELLGRVGVEERAGLWEARRRMVGPTNRRVCGRGRDCHLTAVRLIGMTALTLASPRLHRTALPRRRDCEPQRAVAASAAAWHT